MTLKTVAASASLDEIDEIMNEIEQLQQSMNSSQAPVAKTAPKPNAAPAPVAAAPVETSEPAAPEAGDSQSDSAADSMMNEFRGGGGDGVSMEETLANLKDDEPSGPNLIDQAMEAEAAQKASEKVADAPEATESSEDDLLDDSEAEALENAIAAEERALEEQALEEQVTEEQAMMEEVSRRKRRESSDASTSTVALKLTGDMKLRLNYEFEGQEVRISFSDGALRVELSDGTEFKIPVRRNSLRKVA